MKLFVKQCSLYLIAFMAGAIISRAFTLDDSTTLVCGVVVFVAVLVVLVDERRRIP